MNISVFGLGYVGCVSLGCLSSYGHNVIGIDIDQNKVNTLNDGEPTIVEPGIDVLIADGVKNKKITATTNSRLAIENSEISIICVGTPLNSENGKLELTYIYKVIDDIAKAIKEKDDFHIIAIRSTVAPGTCDKIEDFIQVESGKERNIDFSVLSNPEFLREGTAINDFNNPPYSLIGGNHSKSIERLSKVYEFIDAEVITVDRRVAEIIKYVNNSFHALKVGFTNEIGNICKALDIDSRIVMDIFCKDSKLNISSYYLKPGFAYGGSCLPKDLAALNAYANEYELKVPIIDSIAKSNKSQIDRAFNMLLETNKNSFGFLGISFKSGTDDLRNSPIIPLISKLIDHGCIVKAFDKNISLTRLIGANKIFLEENLPDFSNIIFLNFNEVIDNSDVLILSNGDYNCNEIIESDESKIIFDLVHDTENTSDIKNYIGINW